MTPTHAPTRPGPDAPALRAALDAEWREIDSDTCGRIGYYAETAPSGTPLLLVHSLNAAPSAMEMRPLFDHYRGKRPVVALDQPGFGRSERGERPDTPELLARAVEEVAAAAFDAAPDVIALSLGAEIAARAMLTRPEAWKSLAMISPTGFALRQPPGDLVADGVEWALGGRLVRDRLFRALTRPGTVRFFLARNCVDAPDPDLVDYAVETARQPGAAFGPIRFLSGRLFTREARTRLYDRLSVPILVLFDEDPNVGFETLERWIARRATRRAERIAPSKGLPHWERLAPCVEALERFWTETDGGD
ncbi:MAG: alpha/beta hydrolase [Myxococcota bacterium]